MSDDMEEVEGIKAIWNHKIKGGSKNEEHRIDVDTDSGSGCGTGASIGREGHSGKDSVLAEEEFG